MLKRFLLMTLFIFIILAFITPIGIIYLITIMPEEIVDIVWLQISISIWAITMILTYIEYRLENRKKDE